MQDISSSSSLLEEMEAFALLVGMRQSGGFQYSGTNMGNGNDYVVVICMLLLIKVFSLVSWESCEVG